MVEDFSSTLGMIYAIFAEINFREKKSLSCESYSPHKSNISNHLHHLGKGLDNYTEIYDNILLLGDFNWETLLEWFLCYLKFKKACEERTCYKNPDKTSCIDYFLTNRSWTFQCTNTIETTIFLARKAYIVLL